MLFATISGRKTEMASTLVMLRDLNYALRLAGILVHLILTITQ